MMPRESLDSSASPTSVWRASPIRVLRLGITDWWRTQALYHAIAELMIADRQDTIILCRPATPYVCIGYHQGLDGTLDRRECQRRELPVFRRRLGGGATYLDVNQLFYQCIFHHSRVPICVDDLYQRLLSAPVATLRRLGLDASLCFQNEIEVAGKRIAGTGSGRTGEASVVVGNFLFDFDYTSMSHLWRVPSEVFRILAANALSENVTTLKALEVNISVESVEDMLLEEFSRTLNRPLAHDTPAEDEERFARRLADRMSSPRYVNFSEMNAVPSPKTSLKISARSSIYRYVLHRRGEEVSINLSVRDGVIQKAVVESGSAEDRSAVECLLEGMPFDSWQQQLSVVEELFAEV